jgi:hypothetical protein
LEKTSISPAALYHQRRPPSPTAGTCRTADHRYSWPAALPRRLTTPPSSNPLLRRSAAAPSHPSNLPHPTVLLLRRQTSTSSPISPQRLHPLPSNPKFLGSLCRLHCVQPQRC